MQEFADMINSVGLPVGLVLVFLFAVWKIARWASPIIQKLVENHVIFLDATKNQQKRTVEAIETQTELLSGISRTNRSLSHLADAAKNAIDQNDDAARQSLDKMREVLND